MARYSVRVADNFVEEAACLDSERMFNRVQMIAESLSGNPYMGKPCEDEAVLDAYGETVYAYAMAAFQVLYRFDGTMVDLLGVTLLPPVGE